MQAQAAEYSGYAGPFRCVPTNRALERWNTSFWRWLRCGFVILLHLLDAEEIDFNR